jgi:hypothetical protein
VRSRIGGDRTSRKRGPFAQLTIASPSPISICLVLAWWRIAPRCGSSASRTTSPMAAGRQPAARERTADDLHRPMADRERHAERSGHPAAWGPCLARQGAVLGCDGQRERHVAAKCDRVGEVSPQRSKLSKSP